MGLSTMRYVTDDLAYLTHVFGIVVGALIVSIYRIHTGDLVPNVSPVLSAAFTAFAVALFIGMTIMMIEDEAEER